LMTGVDYPIKQGIAHPDSLGVMGWSAGGHLTNWTVTHTNRFKAASSGAGGADWFSFYAQTDMQYIREIWFDSSPYDNTELWQRKSPVYYVKNATTPTLIFCGENDRRVPFPQSQQMYRGLKRNGCPVEFVVFPRAGHGPGELRHQMYKMKKEFAWFEHYIRGKEMPEDLDGIR
ncbi:MAG: alpha/beta hydrolase family protein, partial [Candidatus Zixiibacteriota bacterium]